MDIATKRLKATKQFMQLFDEIENTKGGYNATSVKEMLDAMSDTEFIAYMKNMRDDPDFNPFFEIDTMNENGTPDMARIKAVADKWGVELEQYVAFPHRNPNDPEHPVITKTKVPKLYITARRLVQMLDKKNADAANIDQVNPITGQVTGDSKAASMSDTQTASLAAVGMTRTIKEFLGFRADDQVAKLKAIESIEKYGMVRMDDLNQQTSDKQSIQTMETFLIGAGLISSFNTK